MGTSDPAPGPSGWIGDVRLFNLFAGAYDRLQPTADREKLEAGLELAQRDIVQVLDVAGGSGQGIRALEGVEGVVVDAAPGMVRRAAHRGLTAVRGDGARLPVRGGSVDAVLVIDALHHIGDPSGLLDEGARVLRPDGVLIVAEFDPTTVLGRTVAAAEHLVGFQSQFFAPGDLVAMVRAAGLDASIPRRGFEYVVAGVKPR